MTKEYGYMCSVVAWYGDIPKQQDGAGQFQLDVPDVRPSIWPIIAGTILIVYPIALLAYAFWKWMGWM